MSIKFTTLPAKFLYQPLLSTDVTFKLADITGFNGNNLTAADFGTVGYGVLLNSDRSVMELFSWDPTTIASTSISFVDRGLPFDGDDTPVTAYKLDWPAGSTVLLGSDTPQFIQWLKDYIDSVAIAGSPNASTVLQGLVQESTQAQRDAGTAAGSTSARLFSNPSTERGKLINDYAVDASGTDAYAITITPAITAYAAGQRFTFKAGTANTGACTLNVSGLGAKTIKKDVSSDLATGDILANQIVEVEYDGTNMQMVSTVPTPHNTYPVDIQTFTASDTWTKPTTGTPKFVYIQAWGGGGGGAKQAGGGGGGGAYTERWLPASSLGATETVTIGAGGSGTASNGAGGPGGNTTIGSLVTAYGGGGAAHGGGGGGGGGGVLSAASIVNGGSPITATTAGLTNTGFGGGNGGTGTGGDAVYGGAGGAGSSVGSGGSSLWGGAGGGNYQSTTAGTSKYGGNGGAGANGTSGIDGTVPGGGGGGTHTGTTSGAGAGGKVIITTFF